jgi:phosphohistidine phosphatase SixA
LILCCSSPMVRAAETAERIQPHIDSPATFCDHSPIRL